MSAQCAYGVLWVTILPSCTFVFPWTIQPFTTCFILVPLQWKLNFTCVSLIKFVCIIIIKHHAHSKNYTRFNCILLRTYNNQSQLYTLFRHKKTYKPQSNMRSAWNECIHTLIQKTYMGLQDMRCIHLTWLMVVIGYWMPYIPWLISSHPSARRAAGEVSIKKVGDAAKTYRYADNI